MGFSECGPYIIRNSLSAAHNDPTVGVVIFKRPDNLFYRVSVFENGIFAILAQSFQGSGHPKA
jgi:hypothetical protein